MTQTTSHIIMIEPRGFLSNPQTTASNTHQHKNPSDTAPVQEKALAEHRAFQALLKANGIQITLFEGQPDAPDDLFCNNWIMTREDNTYSLFPLMAPNRRAERRQDIVEALPHQLFKDYSPYEQQNMYLESTGSLVLDRTNKVAYATLSPRTHAELVTLWSQDHGYTPLTFRSYDAQGKPEYHTNVVLFIGSTLAGVCLDMIDEGDQEKVRASLSQHHTLLELSRGQIEAFAGNALEIRNSEGKRFLVMSQQGYTALTPPQHRLILDHVNDVITPNLTTIETYGGGSARCLMLEVFGGV